MSTENTTIPETAPVLKKYTVRAKNTPILMIFEYDLDGHLRHYNLIEGELTAKMVRWLFTLGHFPHREAGINSWTAISNFEILTTEPDVTFDTFYHLFNYKVKKVGAQKTWERLSKLDRLNAIRGIKPYINFLRRQNGRQQQANPQTYLNQRYWEDDYASL